VFTISTIGTEIPLEPIRHGALAELTIIFKLFSYISVATSQSTVEYRLPGNEEPVIPILGQILYTTCNKVIFPSGILTLAQFPL